MTLRERIQKEYHFVGIFRESSPMHFYLIQGFVFLYYIYWFLSKDFTVYGYFHCTDGMFRSFVFDGVAHPPFYYLSFQFIYHFVPYLNTAIIYVLQWLVVSLALFGLCGILPKWCAWICFVIAYHFVGIELLCNGNMDAATTLQLCAMLILAIAPSQAYYKFRKDNSLSRSSVQFHWPVFLFLLTVSVYYTTAGINKIVDTGPHWPLTLHLDKLSRAGLESSLFLGHTYNNPAVLQFFTSYWVSASTGMVTMIGELFFVLILFYPRSKWFFIPAMCLMHVFIYYTHGLNYTGNILFLLLCFDYNTFFKRMA